MSADEPVAHFAVPEGIDQASLEILWPNGRLQTAQLTQWNAHHLIQEAPDLSPVVSRESGKTQPLYAGIQLPPDLTHRENPYDDFAVQPLLPARLSNLACLWPSPMSMGMASRISTWEPRSAHRGN